MSDKDQKKQSFIDKMRESYRMVVYRSDDFSEVRSFNLSLGSIYTAISMISLFMIVLTYSLFAFTPLKNLIPGYGDVKASPQVIQLIEGVEDLSYQIDAQQTYLNAFKNLLTSAAEMGESQYVAIQNKPNDPAPRKNSISLNKRDESGAEPRLSGNSEKVDNAEIYMTMRESDIIEPVDGVISSEFQPEIRHYGIDILAPKNTAVKTIMDGFVFSSGWDLETGYTLGIQHKGNILSFYKHNSILLKEKGTFVRAGEAVAIIGNTGTLSSGPHLHFELWHNGKPVNPKDFINFN